MYWSALFERPDLPAAELITGYIFRSLKNRIIDMSRTRKKMISLNTGANDDLEAGGHLLDLLRDTQASAEMQLHSHQVSNVLYAGLEILSEIERYVIIAHELEGVPFKDLAVDLDVPQNTLLSHKARGMKKLRKYFLESHNELFMENE